jgi:ribonuclease D
MLLAEQIQYAAEDVEHLHALEEKLNAELKAAALMEVFRLEMDLLPVVVGMELKGFCVDRKKLEEQRLKLHKSGTKWLKLSTISWGRQLKRSRSAPGGLARPRNRSQEYERGFFIGMPTSGCRRYLGVQ